MEIEVCVNFGRGVEFIKINIDLEEVARKAVFDLYTCDPEKLELDVRGIKASTLDADLY